MKFKYKKLAPGFIRPIIPIEIIFNQNSIKYEVLIDSGADENIFDAQIGELLGIDIIKGEKRKLSGITGVKEIYYIHPITIKVGGWKYKTKAGFLPNIASLGYGVVGQRGFFDIFVVKFNFKKGIVELKEAK